jgi:ABC-2 type transport system permease protein
LALEPLGYRPFEGRLRGGGFRFWPIARKGLALLLGRKVVRVFLLISLLDFAFHSAIIYLQAQVEGKMGYRIPARMREAFPFSGGGEAYQNFISFQGTVVVVMLALAGGLLVGGDFRANALPFYLSKPITRLDYLLGKVVAAGTLTALITLAPALVLFLEYGAFTESFAYYRENLHLLGAIAGYGTMVSVTSAVLILAVASTLKRTIPLVLGWAGLFVFLPAVGEILRDVESSLGHPGAWRWALLDLWADQRWISNFLFGLERETNGERLPYAAAVLGGAVLTSVVVFWRRIVGAEVVR